MKALQYVLGCIIISIVFGGILIEIPALILFVHEMGYSQSFVFLAYFLAIVVGSIISGVFIPHQNSVFSICFGLIVAAFSLGMFSLSSSLYHLIFFRVLYGLAISFILPPSFILFSPSFLHNHSVSSINGGIIASVLFIILIGFSNIFFSHRDLHSIFLMIIFAYTFIGFLILILKEHISPFIKSPRPLNWSMLKILATHNGLKLCSLATFTFTTTLALISKELLAEEIFLNVLFLCSLGIMSVFLTPIKLVFLSVGSTKSITIGLLFAALSLSLTSILYYDLIIYFPFIFLGMGTGFICMGIFQTFTALFNHARSVLLFSYFTIVLSLGWVLGSSLAYLTHDLPLTSYLFGSLLLTLVSIVFIREIQIQHLPHKISR